MTRHDVGNDGGESMRPGSLIQNDAVRRQLARLFGESDFGPWPELEHLADTSRKRRSSKGWLLGLCVLVTCAAATFAVRALVKPGVEHHVEGQRGHYAEELRTFLKDGNLERAAQFVALVEEQAEGAKTRAIDPKDTHLELIVSAEAALYRYFDASPERLLRIRPYLDDTGRTSPSRQIAWLTILSRQERAAQLGTIESLHNDAPESNELEYLLATALEYSNNAPLSRDAWQRSAKLEPAWLGHRFEQAWFEWRQHRAPEAQQITLQMLRFDPDSPWSKLAISAFALPKSEITEGIHSGAAAPIATPVEIYFERLFQGLAAAHRKDLAQAMEQLALAASAIQHQPPFLFDAFDWCLAEQEPVLAEQLVSMHEWPEDSALAKSKIERLSNLQRERKESPARRP